jgi:gamma-glutamyltranspeptidase/glutathione hydrolase
MANGGVLTKEDFAAYTVTESMPVTCAYRGYTIVSAPPPSSGGATLCEMLRVLEVYPLKTLGFHSSDSIHLMTEAMRYAYSDRNTFLGDPAFVSNPVDRLLSERHVQAIRAQIRPHRAGVSKVLGASAAPEENANTTHYSKGGSCEPRHR